MQATQTMDAEKTATLPAFTINDVDWDAELFTSGVEHALEVFGRHSKYPRMSFRYMRYWYSACVLRTLQKKIGNGGITVAEMGIGDAVFPVFASAGLEKPRWIGMDMNEKRVTDSNGRFAEVHLANFNETLPLPDASVDAVNFLHVIEHVSDEHHTLKEIHRILRPGGLLVAASPVLPKFFARIRQRQFEREFASGKRKPGKHIRVFWPKRWVSTLDENGFEPLDLRGGYFLRSSYNFLENYTWWMRLNVFYGRMFKSFGNEILVTARKR